jgi:NitT/TauT family transport system permease protein
MGMNRYVRFALNPLFSILRPIPTIAFIPLAILWFGIGETSKILMIFGSAFLYIVLNTYTGVIQIPIGYKRVAQNLGARPAQMFWRVILPGAAPSIMTGVKVGLAISWSVVVAAELIAAQQGLGYMIMDAATFFRIPVVYIGVLLIGVVGFLLEGALSIVEHKFVHWTGR